MEIIKRGQLPEERKFVFSCGECNSIVRATAAEGQTVYNYQGDYISFKCPVCKNCVNVNLNQGI